MPRPSVRPAFGDLALIAVLAVTVVSGGGWFVWDGIQNERDLERRWALPGEAKALAEEEIALAPPNVAALAEADVKAAAERYEQASACPEGIEDARRRYQEEVDAATAKAEQRMKELEARAAARRLELRRQALALVAEWDALFARHPEWPPHRLTPAE